ncbi:hypothetical protein AZE42_00644 [Rhizopogon vesiculosus]|uniref:Arf-GAP domain-containing protein n=1 Tax=Rhizopogon vesiculosus TaxID=180088 RepID=A0A1J8Q993_9AGAM|nr:hypothetical protein AZE42_00644 [Rhizopogon vesiculosus]
MSSGISKISSERSQRTLLELVMQPGNGKWHPFPQTTEAAISSLQFETFAQIMFIKYSVNCASIHRKLGTHITKVKSITLDSWTKEQVEVMKQNGNIKSNNLYNPDEARHPPPTNMMEAERDSEIEKFIRAKYEFKWFMNCKPSQLSPPVRTSSNAVTAHSISTLATGPAPVQRKPSPAPPPVPAKYATNGGIRSFNVATDALPPWPTPTQPTRSISQPLSTPGFSAPIQGLPGNQVWDDLLSLQGPSQSSSLPLQYKSPNFSSPSPSVPSQSPLGNPTFHVSPNPFSALQSSHMMPTSMPSMSNPTSVTQMHGGPNPQTPFQQQFSGFPFSNTLNSIPPQMGVGGLSGTPGVASLPQQSHFAQSFGQYPQPAPGHMQDPNLIYAQPQPQVVQQQYSPQSPFGAAPAFVAQQQQQTVFQTNAAYGGWQNMHGNF